MIAPQDRLMGRGSVPQPLSRNREHPPPLPTTEGHLTDTRRWRGYPPQRQASDVFSREVLPHLAPVFVDLIRGKRNAQPGPQALYTLERLLLCFSTEA